MYKRAVKALSQEGGWESESSISSASGTESEANDSDSSDGTDSQSDEDVEALLTDLLEKDPELLEKISEIKKEYAASIASDSKAKLTVTSKEKEDKKISFPCSLCPEKEIHTELAYSSHLISKLHLRRSKKIEQKGAQVIEAAESKAKAPKHHKKRKISDKTD